MLSVCTYVQYVCVTVNIDCVTYVCACVCREKEEWLVWMDDPVRMGNLVHLELLDYGSDHFNLCISFIFKAFSISFSHFLNVFGFVG